VRLEAHLRRAATWLLRGGIRIAPRDMSEWGRAMLGELGHVEGSWAALMWALSGAGVLAKHALVSFLIPGPRRHRVLGGELLAKEGTMRKGTLIMGAACVVAALLFFLAPAFRQAFRVSLAQWDKVLHVTTWNQQPDLEALARRAAKQRDAEGLAFVAVRLRNPSESARLAEKAVRLDPRLIWVYAIVAVRHPELDEIAGWVQKLEQWDPQNALPHFITAESIDIAHVLREDVSPRGGENDPAWRSAMAAAFQSRKLDDYLDRLRNLDRRVVPRYGFDDPYQVVDGEEQYGLPSYTAWDSSRYAKSLLESGQELEAGGDREGALKNYWTVARFGGVIGSRGGFFVGRILEDAYKRLAALCEKEGNHEQAAFFGDAAEKAGQEVVRWDREFQGRLTGPDISLWDASVVKISGLMMFVFGGLFAICALLVLAGSWTVPPGAFRAGPVSAALGVVGAVGSLVSSATLYVSYRPYAAIFKNFLLTGDTSQVAQLSNFLSHAQVPLGVRNFYELWDFVFHFWVGLTLLGVIGLLLLTLRHLRARSRASAPALT